MTLFTFPKCPACKKAKKWLKDNGFSYHEENLSLLEFSEVDIEQWVELSGKNADYFTNTKSNLFLAAGLHIDFPKMTEEEKIHILSLDTRLLKRPIVVQDLTVLAGFSSRIWEKALVHNGEES